MLRGLPEGKFFRPKTGIVFLIGILVLTLAGCESIFGPSADDSDDDDDDDGEARILVTNNYGVDLDIYMDGAFQFLLPTGETTKIRDVTLDDHDLEAKLPGTSSVVESEEVDVTDYTDYTWAIDDSPDINVVNNYGVTLRIYMDGTYCFDIADEENRWLMNVSFGDHFLKATKADGKEIASTTLEIDENTDYTWTIK